MNLSEKNIKTLISEVVENHNFLLIETIIRGYGNNSVIEVFVDGEAYVSADDCSKLSRAINEKLENLILSGENYRLDVSSPGTDRPLIFLKQFTKHINRKFELSFNQDNELKKTTAKLVEIKNDDLTFQLSNGQELVINFNNIVKAKVIISFS